MALAPHWLDQSFGADDLAQVIQAIANDPKFVAAVKAGLAAKKASEQRFRDNPGLMAAGPAQEARRKFIEAVTDAAGQAGAEG